ncbi:hypothetical protein JCM9803A_09830 [Rhodococcus erythropolis]
MSWMTTKEAAEYSRCHELTVLRAAREKKLKGAQRGQKCSWRFKESDVDRWLAGK